MPEHTCRAPGCDRAREEWALTCRECWGKVPQELKQKRTEANHGTVEHGLACYAIINWLAGRQQELEL